MSKIQDSLSLFEKNVAKMLDLVGTLSEDQINWKMKLVLDDERWSVRQIVAHMEEVNYFWLAQFKEILAGSSRNCGRTAADYEARLKAVHEADNRPLADITTHIKKSMPLIRETLGAMTDEQMNMLVPVEGAPQKVPLGFMINHVYPEHAEEHI
jgi:uncharacterized damage-inducible protein DinB